MCCRFHRGGDHPQRAGAPDLRLKLLAALAHRALAPRAVIAFGKVTASPLTSCALGDAARCPLLVFAPDTPG
jgi:hypothetical protein